MAIGGVRSERTRGDANGGVVQGQGVGGAGPAGGGDKPRPAGPEGSDEGGLRRVGVEQSGFGALSPAGFARLKSAALAPGALRSEPEGTQPGPGTFDRTPGVRLYNTQLFIKGAGDADAIAPNDVAQGQLGDCYLLASLVAMARTPEGRERLKGMVEERRDARGLVASYVVTLKEHDDGASRKLGKDVYRDVRVEVPPDFQMTRLSAGGSAKHTDLVSSDDPKGAVMAGAARTADRGPDGSVEVWVAVIEKAYAKSKGGFSSIGHGGFADAAMPALTGAPRRKGPSRGPAPTGPSI